MRRGLLLTAALCVVVTLSGCADGDAAPATVPERVSADGVELRTRVLGEGSQVVLLLHGGPGLSLEAMAPLDALLTDERRLVSYDQRGAGRTGSPADGELGLAAHVADVEAVRRFTGADRVWLVGQSWGGLLAGAYAAAHPDRVAALVLLSAAPPELDAFVQGQEDFAQRLARLQTTGVVPTPLPSSTDGSCLPGLIAVLPVYAADPAAPPQGAPGVTCTAGTAEATYGAVLRSEVLEPVAAGLAQYEGPALVVHGAQDPFGPSWPRAWQQLLPQADELEVPGAGHMPVLEQPDLVLPALNRFLREPS